MDKSIKTIKSIALILLLCAFFATPSQSQVTIGMQDEPLKGTLLDLKETNSNGGATTTKGMMYPRVSLVSLNGLQPILTGLDATYESLNLSSYTGLTVYNVNETEPFVKGLYTWDGTQWVRTGTVAEAKNGLSLEGSDTVVLGGTLEKNTTIDFAGKDLNFETSNGRILLNSVNNTATNADVAQLAVDNATGEVVAIRSSTGNAKPFNYVKYIITCSADKPDWIQFFDTKIPVNEYTVFVAGYQFTTSDNATVGLKMDTGTTGTFSPANVTAFKSDGTSTYNTWRLNADFNAASTANNLRGTWTIHCIIINNSIMQQLNDITKTLDRPYAEADSKPAGL